MSSVRLSGADRDEWELSLLGRAKKGDNHVLMALLRYAGGKAECWPSNDRLSKDTGLSTKSIKTHLAALEGLGVFRRVEDLTLRTQRRFIFPTHPSQGVANIPGREDSSPPSDPQGGKKTTGGGEENGPPGGEENGPPGGEDSSPQILSENREKEEPSVSQSGDDRPTDDSLSLTQEEWGPEDGPEKIRELIGLLDNVPNACQKAALDLENRRFFEGRWDDLAKALIVATQPKRRRNPVQNGVGYLRNLMGKPDELKSAQATLDRFLDGTLAATKAAMAEREAKYWATLKADIKAEEEEEERKRQAKANQTPKAPVPTPPKVAITRTDQFLLKTGEMPDSRSFFDVAMLQFRGVNLEETAIAEAVMKECEAMLESQRVSPDGRPGYIVSVQREIDRWRASRKRAREGGPPPGLEWCLPPRLRKLAGS